MIYAIIFIVLRYEMVYLYRRAALSTLYSLGRHRDINKYGTCWEHFIDLSRWKYTEFYPGLD